jgi:hypothetical protein
VAPRGFEPSGLRRDTGSPRSELVVGLPRRGVPAARAVVVGARLCRRTPSRVLSSSIHLPAYRRSSLIEQVTLSPLRSLRSTAPSIRSSLSDFQGRDPLPASSRPTHTVAPPGASPSRPPRHHRKPAVDIRAHRLVRVRFRCPILDVRQLLNRHRGDHRADVIWAESLFAWLVGSLAARVGGRCPRRLGERSRHGGKHRGHRRG